MCNTYFSIAGLESCPGLYLSVVESRPAAGWHAMNPSCIVPFGGLRSRPGQSHPLVDYLLSLTGKERPRVAFIPTARGDDAAAIVHLHRLIPGEKAIVSHLALFDRHIRDIEAYLLGQDLIWVGGGNTASMLAVWRTHGVDRALAAARDAGVVLTGGSAGSLCWFECGTTDSFDLNELAPLKDGLGFLKGSHCPHFDGEAQRRPLYHRLVGEGFPAGYAIDDDAAICFVGGEVRDVVSAREGAAAYRVELVEGCVRESRLEARLLI